ncbi:hypothetical protein [Sorangium sp. So ce233]|uniref:hypothetical protein n=1 Tax=Sorangium sp. So ce233 TaxID=3133290 RepID=UPI003F630409
MPVNPTSPDVSCSRLAMRELTMRELTMRELTMRELTMEDGLRAAQRPLGGISWD